MSKRKSTENRKAEILRTALDLAFEVGPDRVSTGMISDRLGLTQPAIYKHFRSKKDLWRAAAETLCERIGKNIAAATDEPDPLDRLRMLVLGHLKLVAEIPALPEIMVMRDPKGTQNATRSLIQVSMAGFRATIVDTIEEARDAGCFHAEIDARDGATLLFGIIQSLALRLLLSRNPDAISEDGARLLELQLALFTRQGELN